MYNTSHGECSSSGLKSRVHALALPNNAQPSWPLPVMKPSQQRLIVTSDDPSSGLAHAFYPQHPAHSASSYDAHHFSPAGCSQTPILLEHQGRTLFQVAPERNLAKYGSVAQSNRKKCERLASDFFKDGVKRVRDRNAR